MFTKTLLLLFTMLNGQAQEAPEPAEKNPIQITESKRSNAPTKARAPKSPTRKAAPDKATSKRPAPLRVAARLTADQVVSKVQAFYTDTKQLTAFFRQTYTNATFGKTSKSDGEVRIKKPGKMRWDYKGKNIKVKKSFISDGATLWAVEHDNKQVLMQSLNDNMLPVAVTFLYGKGDLSRDFSAAIDGSGNYGKKSDYVLELTPRTPSAQYKKLYLVVDAGNFRVKQSVVIEASGNVNHFRFYSPNTKRPVKDSWFVVNVKKLKNYRVIEPNNKAKK